MSCHMTEDWLLKNKELQMFNSCFQVNFPAFAVVTWAIHMNEFLVKECANQGGCRRFGCECCYKDRSTHRSWGEGHCTSACGCCIRTRKSKKNVRKQDNLEDFTFNVVAGNVFSIHMGNEQKSVGSI